MESTKFLQNKWACNSEYLEHERKRVKTNVFKKQKHAFGFENSEKLASWWLEQMKIQNDSCMYCKTPIRLVEALIKAKHLLGRRTRGLGIRGPYLELERMDNSINRYSPQNCVLICYYCNNDKSHVYPVQEYIDFLAAAKYKHFLYLADKMSK
ncbi:MAG: hypothetical protein JNM39_09760 [Bdellovibrionaceae bacterium]|nr:hypothetical protein [Pseudobdellovibrionaceae bacterium]